MSQQVHPDVARHFLDDIIETLYRYKDMSEKAIAQVPDDKLHWRPDDEANSIAINVRHMVGNMHSRFTDFLTTDGEKPWRHRDTEFEPPEEDRAALMERWNGGWKVLMNTLESLSANDTMSVITIRGEDHTVVQALVRAISHYAYHVGQIVQLARQLVGPDDWQTLSIARGDSEDYRPTGRL
ncbi:MAG: DUF1572 domain-containing protein [Thermoanaerobaculia bacterium]|nr:DUF1572 domain-containing protein [Thermoanaerobaculia bacterium]